MCLPAAHTDPLAGIRLEEHRMQIGARSRPLQSHRLSDRRTPDEVRISDPPRLPPQRLYQPLSLMCRPRTVLVHQPCSIPMLFLHYTPVIRTQSRRFILHALDFRSTYQADTSSAPNPLRRSQCESLPSTHSKYAPASHRLPRSTGAARSPHTALNVRTRLWRFWATLKTGQRHSCPTRLGRARGRWRRSRPLRHIPLFLLPSRCVRCPRQPGEPGPPETEGHTREEERRQPRHIRPSFREASPSSTMRA